METTERWCKKHCILVVLHIFLLVPRGVLLASLTGSVERMEGRVPPRPRTTWKSSLQALFLCDLCVVCN